VAKVLVSIPDPLLRELDLRAGSLGESRSGYLQRLAEEDIERREQQGRENARRIMDLIRAEWHDDEPPLDAAQLIREDRDSR
jgi:metal-responsive CopG/Arc/MetJ family transcriptional regulator